LPSCYNDSIDWPVVYIFEPGARALLPINKYKGIAERLGYIIVCSYNSHNGAWDPVIEAANAMFMDTYVRYSLYQERIYTIGFSGGARAACMMAVATGKICGVIACGAGYPTTLEPKNLHTFDLLGITGYGDMNYLEMIKLDSLCYKADMNHQLLFFDGTHEWPPEQTMLEAFYWLELNAMKKDILPHDNKLIAKAMLNIGKNGIYKSNDEKDDLLKHFYLRKLMNYKSGLLSTDSLANKLEELIVSQNYKQNRKIFEEICNTEGLKREEYILELMDIGLLTVYPAHSVKSNDWWKKELVRLSEQESQNGPIGEKNSRLFDFIWRNAWEQHFIYQNQGQYEIAIRYMRICESAIPQESWPKIILARLYIEANKENIAMTKLKKAIELGFSDVDYLRNDSIFVTFNGRKKYEKIIESINTSESQ
ncbi:MAG: hypothetical protein K8S18_04850, partial [Desulfobacula sp.]|nr:hypothetical protein [Desulfobacula sp.]